MNTRQFVLFDFDGVIANSHAVAYELSRHFSPELDDAKYRALYERNIFQSLKALPSWKDTLPEEYQKRYDTRMHEVVLYEGMDDVIRTFSNTYGLAIISSTSTSGITDFLGRYELSHYFSDILGREDHHSKVEKMRTLLEKYALSPSDCIYITDTLGDMHEANEHAMATIGVTWGVHPRETLEKGLPFRIVEKPLDLLDTVEEFFRRS